jgi:hypothetical protein
MSLGAPFSGNPTCTINLSAVNTVQAANTTFPTPTGDAVWVVNLNSATVAYVLLSQVGETNTAASAGNGVPIPPSWGMLLRGPWPGAFNGSPQISALLASGGNTSGLLACAGYGQGH